jgi:hypothetical protein
MKKSELPIATPCTADWRSMTPADGGRFCGDCKKVVRDLSTMRERDARNLLRSNDNGALCVRYLYDRHGRIFFAGDAGDPQALVPASFLQRAKRAALTAAMIAAPLSLQACSASSPSSSTYHADPKTNHDHEELMENMGGAPPMPDDRDTAVDAAGEGGDSGVDSDAAERSETGPDATADAEPPI